MRASITAHSSSRKASTRKAAISSHVSTGKKTGRGSRASKALAARSGSASRKAALETRRGKHTRPATRLRIQRASYEAAPLTKMRYEMPDPLRGSLESLTRQNQRTEAEGLERIENDEDLNDRIAHKLLVPIPTSSALGVNNDLPENRRYCRAWTAQFLSDLARAHDALFKTPLMVTSAVRTVEYQKRLMGVNGNATQAEGDVVSPHLTGATIDIGKTGMSRQEIGWMRKQLLALQNSSKIDVEEEFRQPCFHITVYKEYASTAPNKPPSHEKHTAIITQGR